MPPSKKNKKKKVHKNTPATKSRLWLRDLLNICIGIVVTLIFVFIIQAYVDRAEARKVLAQYSDIVRQDLSDLAPLVERYSLTGEENEDILMALEGADISRPVCALETYEMINKNLHKLSPQVMNSFLSYYHHVRDVELLRKCIIEQQNNPEEIDRILVREFLRTIYDGTQLIPPLLLELKDSGRGG